MLVLKRLSETKGICCPQQPGFLPTMRTDASRDGTGKMLPEAMIRWKFLQASKLCALDARVEGRGSQRD